MSDARWITEQGALAGRRFAHATRVPGPLAHQHPTICGLTLWAPRLVDQTRIDGEVQFCSECRTRLLVAEPSPHQHEAWMLREDPEGRRYCAACGEHVEPDLSRVRYIDLDPAVGVQHRCPRMREHVEGSWRDTGKPGSHPRDLPVPCDECYSIVVTSVRIPWQPATRFTITDERKNHA